MKFCVFFLILTITGLSLSRKSDWQWKVTKGINCGNNQRRIGLFYWYKQLKKDQTLFDLCAQKCFDNRLGDGGLARSHEWACSSFYIDKLQQGCQLFRSCLQWKKSSPNHIEAVHYVPSGPHKPVTITDPGAAFDSCHGMPCNSNSDCINCNRPHRDGAKYAWCKIGGYWKNAKKYCRAKDWRPYIDMSPTEGPEGCYKGGRKIKCPCFIGKDPLGRPC